MKDCYNKQEQFTSKNLLYHLRATVDAPDGSSAALKQLQDLIVAFAINAVRMTPPSASQIEEGFSYTSEDGSRRFECLTIPDGTIWSARIQYPDQLEDTPFSWFLDIAIVEENDQLHFGLKIESTRGTDVKKLQLQLPLLDELLALGTLRQENLLNDNLWRVNLPAEVPELIRFLESPNRHLAVVVISAVNRNQWSFTATAPLYLINAEYLASHTQGFAFVVQLGYAAAYEFSNTVGRNWAVFDGAVRVYLPYLSFQNGNPREHRSKLKGEIWFWTFNNQTGSSVYTSFLIDSARYWEPRNHVNMKGLSFVPDTRVAAAERELDKLPGITDPQEREKICLHTIEALRQKLQIIEEENYHWAEELSRAESSVEFFQKENNTLRSQLETLRGRNAGPSAAAGVPQEKFSRYPETLAGLGNWARERLAGKVILLPKAEEMAAHSEYQDVPAVCRALQILAHEYRDSQMGFGSEERFLAALQRCGMNFSGGSSGAQYGESDRTYFVTYPAGSDRKEMMHCHIFKENSHDPHHMLKIYFFWDAENDLVVVGALPKEPDTDQE